MRKGRGFYSLRHTFETIGGDSRDQVAVNHIMGHADASMAGIYRERIEDQRLIDVVNHVRRWLFRRDSADLWQTRRERKGGA
jgi:integrase